METQNKSEFFASGVVRPQSTIRASGNDFLVLKVSKTPKGWVQRGHHGDACFNVLNRDYGPAEDLSSVTSWLQCDLIRMRIHDNVFVEK